MSSPLAYVLNIYGKTRTVFEVRGKPISQGSMKSIGRRMINSNQRKLSEWRETIANAARIAHVGELIEGPVFIVAEFSLSRPKSIPGVRKGWPATRPDDDKLERALKDALKNVVWKDDGQCCTTIVIKRYETPDRPQGVRVMVGDLNEE